MITRGIIKQRHNERDAKTVKYDVYIPLLDGNDSSITHTAVYSCLPHETTIFHRGDVVYVAGADMDFDDLIIMGLVHSDSLASSIGKIPANESTTFESDTQFSMKNIKSLEFAKSGNIILPDIVELPSSVSLRTANKTVEKLNLHSLTGMPENTTLGTIVWPPERGGLGFNYKDNNSSKKLDFMDSMGIMKQIVISQDDFDLLISNNKIDSNTIYYVYSDSSSAASVKKYIKRDSYNFSDYGKYAMNFLFSDLLVSKRINNPTYPANKNGYGPISDEKLWNAKRQMALNIQKELKSFGYNASDIRELQGNRDEPDPHSAANSCVKSYICTLKGNDSSKRVVIGAHYDSVLTDGVEDNGTGVSVLLELAKRFKEYDSKLFYDVDFCFWDGEEFLGQAGSYSYVHEKQLDRTLNQVFLYINLDSIGAGDNLFVYGGKYINNVLKDVWGYNFAMDVAKKNAIKINKIPEINHTQSYQSNDSPPFKPPTRLVASDQLFFQEQKVPYVYFEANAWVKKDGKTTGYPEKPYMYNTTDTNIKSTTYKVPDPKGNPDSVNYPPTAEGQLIHAQKYDSKAFLSTSSGAKFKNNIKTHMAQVSQIVSQMLIQIDADTPSKYAYTYTGGGGGR